MTIRVRWRRSKNLKKNWKFKKRKKSSSGKKKKEEKTNCSILKKTTRVWTKKLTRCGFVSNKSRRNTQRTWLSWEIFKTSTRRKKRNFLIPSDTKKNRSKNSRLSSAYSWTTISWKISSTILNGMKKKGNGLSLTSPTEKGWSIFQNYMEWAKKWLSRKGIAKRLFSETPKDKSRVVEGHRMMVIKWTVLFKMLAKDQWCRCHLANTLRMPMLQRQLSLLPWRLRATTGQKLIWCYLNRTDARELRS